MHSYARIARVMALDRVWNALEIRSCYTFTIDEIQNERFKQREQYYFCFLRWVHEGVETIRRALPTPFYVNKSIRFSNR